MALLGNYTVLSKTPGRWQGGSSGLGKERSNWNKSGASRNRFISQSGFLGTSSTPIGYGPGYALVLAQSTGGLGATLSIAGAGATGTVNLAGGKNGDALLSGTGDVSNAALGLIISLLASLSGTVTLSSALKAIGSIVGSVTASGDVDSAALTGKGNLTKELSGTSELTDALLSASGSMSGDIIVAGELLTTTNVAQSILDAINGVEDGLTVREALRLISAALAGKVSGAGGTTVTIRDVADSKDRIVATVDSNGNRTAITTDVT